VGSDTSSIHFLLITRRLDAMNHEDFIVPPGKAITLKDMDPGSTGKFSDKKDAAGKLEDDLRRLEELQAVLYAQGLNSVLIILQAMDAAGKDSVIKHVMSGLNPQGVTVTSFKVPSAEEMRHDFLWRCVKALPERGQIGIFNRSYYEETLVVRVHPEILEHQLLPSDLRGKDIWKHRFEDINAFERHLTRNGTFILKFFLHVSEKEQKKRFLERIDTPDKNWKFSAGDLKERALWGEYMKAYEDMLNHTSTEWAPWYVVPADHKWFTRMVIADVVAKCLKSMDLAYPTLTEGHMKELEEARRELEKE
jgi:PPK2 family polyphosphate:nucleotide phosphotransferase